VPLLALVVLAGVVRFASLGSVGFSEDESRKAQAVRAYQAGDFSVNAEHPMLMKLAMLVSSRGAEVWNSTVADHGWPTMSPEAALRLPNALAGTATVLAIFLLVDVLFDRRTAWWAALFWALDLLATGINRIGKEDSLVVLFLLLGAWCYERARREGQADPDAAKPWFRYCGATFGLMLASKYVPQHLGIWLVFVRASGSGPFKALLPPRQFWPALVATFLACNVAMWLPATWTYALAYFGGGAMTHHGSLFAGTLYPNSPGASPWGVPPWFYPLSVLTKTPLPVLLVMGVGVVELVRRRTERGATFARVVIVLFLILYSVIAGKFLRYMLPVYAALDIVAAMGVVRILDTMRRARWQPSLRAACLSGIVALMAVAPFSAQMHAMPTPALYRNSIGAWMSPAASLFPNDELYDMGVREAVAQVAAVAAPGAVLVGDGPAALREYLDRSGRLDLEIRALSTQGLPGPLTETWVFAQDSHTYFENAELFAHLRATETPVFVYRAGPITAVEVFRLPRMAASIGAVHPRKAWRQGLLAQFAPNGAHDLQDER
jgi:4-amino-4-deoxy-L-arabinose transferase-like glycosyltransferase